MTRARLVLTITPATLGALVGMAGPSHATPCAEHIATIERRLDSAGAAAVVGSSPNRPVAEGSPKALSAPPPGPSSTGDTGPTPQRIAAARAAIERAKTFEHQGNQDACNNAMSEAKRLMGALP